VDNVGVLIFGRALDEARRGSDDVGYDIAAIVAPLPKKNMLDPSSILLFLSRQPPRVVAAPRHVDERARQARNRGVVGKYPHRMSELSEVAYLSMDEDPLGGIAGPRIDRRHHQDTRQ